MREDEKRDISARLFVLEAIAARTTAHVAMAGARNRADVERIVRSWFDDMTANLPPTEQPIVDAAALKLLQAVLEYVPHEGGAG